VNLVRGTFGSPRPFLTHTEETAMKSAWVNSPCFLQAAALTVFLMPLNDTSVHPVAQARKAKRLCCPLLLMDTRSPQSVEGALGLSRWGWGGVANGPSSSPEFLWVPVAITVLVPRDHKDSLLASNPTLPFHPTGMGHRYLINFQCLIFSSCFLATPDQNKTIPLPQKNHTSASFIWPTNTSFHSYKFM
jgi:hypothetical protein